MQKHKCKLCSRKFATSRALGGHMRSHLTILPIPPKPHVLLSHEAESSSSSDYEEDNLDEDHGEKSVLVSCKMKGNSRKKKIRLEDLEDRESETESTKNNPTRRRSKRQRRPPSPFLDNETEHLTSSVSNVTSEEDVAFCLMMLSRDRWTYHERDSGDISNDVFNSYDITTIRPKGGNIDGRFRYKCEACNKVFGSYQALGGHRASHKKARVATNAQPDTLDNPNIDLNNNNHIVVNNSNNKTELKEKEKRKIHKCPICFRVFLSGQALGGHKRSHVVGDYIDSNQYSSNNGVDHSKNINKKENIILIDLNQPPRVDHDDDDQEISQIADSVVSDHVHL